MSSLFVFIRLWKTESSEMQTTFVQPDESSENVREGPTLSELNKYIEIYEKNKTYFYPIDFINKSGSQFLWVDGHHLQQTVHNRYPCIKKTKGLGLNRKKHFMPKFLCVPLHCTIGFLEFSSRRIAAIQCTSECCTPLFFKFKTHTGTLHHSQNVGSNQQICFS